MRRHAQAVAENRPAREWTGWIHRNHADGHPSLADLHRELVHERALPGARRTGDADEVRPSGVRIDASHEICACGSLVFDERDHTRHRARIAREDAVG
jgi:hypothetical protein